MLRRVTGITEPGEHICRFDELLGALDADRFRLVFSLAKAGRVGQRSEYLRGTREFRFDRELSLENWRRSPVPHQLSH